MADYRKDDNLNIEIHKTEDEEKKSTLRTTVYGRELVDMATRKKEGDE